MSTEISTVQPRGLALDTFEDAFRFSKLVATSDFAPKDFRGKPESCLLAIQHGAELGLSPMQSLQSIAVVNGRPSVYGDTALAVCKGSPVCEWVRETIEGEGEHMVASARPSVAAMLSRSKAGLAWLKPRRPACGASKARGRSTHVACCRCVLAALRCVTRSLTCCVALVTAEEAADYTHVETEPVRVTQPADATGG
jgi:hypothetical protein